MMMGLQLQVPALMLICLLIALLAVIKVCNRYELAISALLLGTTVFGAIGAYIGVAGLGKMLGLLSLFVLKDTLLSLKKNKDLIVTLLIIFFICSVFYLLGPKTTVSSNKLFDIIYHSIIYLIAFNALIGHSTWIRFEHLALALLWFVVCYVFVVYGFELSSSGIDILQISGIRIARTEVNLLTALVGDLNLGGSTVNYQLIGNSSAIGLLFIAVSFLSTRNTRKLTVGWLMVICLGLILILISGARQSILLLAISLASFLFIKKGIDRYRVCKLLLFTALMIVLVIIAGIANETPIIIALFEGGKGVSAIMNRDANFDAAMELIALKPLLGHGLGGFYIPLFGVASGEYRFFPHNVFLELWSEMGLIGMLMFLSSWAILYFKKLRLESRASIFNIYLPNGFTLLPILVFYLVSALMNEILVKSLAFFIMTALYVCHAKKNF